MIEAHGGLERWRSAPTVSFDITSEPDGKDFRVMVEQGARRAYHDYRRSAAHPAKEAWISWDGKQAWSENYLDPTSTRIARGSPRIVALLNYYFFNLPWVAADPGVILSAPGTGRFWEDPTEYITVKMTFEPDVGDSPNDIFVLYIDPTSYRLRATEYNFTYSGVRGPPRIAIYEEFTTVDGLTVPTVISIYGTGEVHHSEDRELHSRREARNWSFHELFDESRMVMPPNAEVDTNLPVKEISQ